MKISMAWWNTSLSPATNTLKSKPLDSKDHTYAFTMIDILINELSFDVIALCEVNDKEISILIEKYKNTKYVVMDGYHKSGRTYFDTCLIFNSEKLLYIEHKNVTELREDRTFKVAQTFVFIITNSTDSDLLILSLSHWPSRLNDRSDDRKFAGECLRNHINTLFEKYANSKTYVILMGDYNDEPFNDSISVNLRSTRDRNHVIKKPSLLYNPFWRELGHKTPFNRDTNHSIEYSGTCYHKAGDLTKWVTFDQIMFSSNFLYKDNWYIDEKYIKIIEFDGYLDLILDSNSSFDHFPIMSVIRKD